MASCSCPFSLDEITKLQKFISFCQDNPEVLNIPQLAFLKNFIEKLGGKIPTGEFKMPSMENMPKFSEPSATPKFEAPNIDIEDEVEAESAESDLELDNEGVIPGDKDEHQEMGDSEKTPTEEEMDQASECRSKAAAAYSEQKFEEAINLYTQAIELNPGNALFYAKRGQAFLKLKKPNACIRDCSRALEINCDSAAAYKFRGRANRLLGNWQVAAKDLRQACKLDFDEEADEWLREVTPNAKKLEQHKIKQERKQAEKELKKRQERVRKAQEANKKAQEEEQKRQANGPGFGGGMPGFGGGMPGFGGGMPGFGGGGGPGGGMPGRGGSNPFGNLDQSELLSAFNDPEVAAAMEDIMGNPANIEKYQSNPKIMNLIAKLGSAMGGAAGGAMPEGFRMAAGGPPPSTKKQPDFTDDGLD